MARDSYIVKDSDDQFVTAADDLEELIDNLKEQGGLKDAEDLIEDYDGF